MCGSTGLSSTCPYELGRDQRGQRGQIHDNGLALMCYVNVSMARDK